MIHKIQNVLSSKSKFHKTEQKCSQVNSTPDLQISNGLILRYFVFLA